MTYGVMALIVLPKPDLEVLSVRGHCSEFKLSAFNRFTDGGISIAGIDPEGALINVKSQSLHIPSHVGQVEFVVTQDGGILFLEGSV